MSKLGGTTIYLGTDDEDNMTSLSGKDLYPNVFEHITNIENLHGHPFSFYQKLGFAIVGVIPDANGPGKPDIIMAKRVGGNRILLTEITKDFPNVNFSSAPP